MRLVSASEIGSRGGVAPGFIQHVVPVCDFLLIHLASQSANSRAPATAWLREANGVAIR